MAINPTFSSAPTLAKVKIGESVYWLKDAELRSIVSAFGTATAKDSTDTVTSNGANLPTESAVYAEIVSQIGALGKVVNLRSEADHTAVTNPQKGDMVVEADSKEWLYDGTAWREVGDESAYVMKTFKLAGIALSDSEITSAALSSALGLEALAFKASASTTLENYVNGLNGADYTPEGKVTVTLEQTGTAATITSESYTPGGNVNVVLSETATAATLSSTSYTPAGSVTVTPSTATFNEVASVGKLPSVDETSGSFATAGVTAAIDASDTEMLVFSNAVLSAALTGTGFNAGELPSLKSKATTIVTGIMSASFTGTEVANMRITGVTYDKTSLSSATFSGTAAENMKITGVTYDKATVDASQTTFAGSSTTITPTLTSASKAISVS